MTADFDWLTIVERGAEANWTHCRSLAERKKGATWDDLTEESKNAWRDLAKVVLVSAEVPELLCEWQEHETRLEIMAAGHRVGG